MPQIEYFKPYRLTKDRLGHKAGTTCYKCVKFDYGMANDDTRMTGINHVTMTLREDGDYPYFTVPVPDLEEVKSDGNKE